MQDLQQMLQKSCKGVDIGEQRITGLFYADDVVLIGNSEKDLTDMLHVSSIFATKWGLKFNSKKSQILIIGQRLKKQKWKLGNTFLSETKTYKYLGVVINRYLTDSDHIKQLLSEKAKKQNGYLRHILANHLDIKRIEFGTTMWKKALLPGLSHAAGVWFDSNPSLQKILSTAQ